MTLHSLLCGFFNIFFLLGLIGFTFICNNISLPLSLNKLPVLGLIKPDIKGMTFNIMLISIKNVDMESSDDESEVVFEAVVFIVRLQVSMIVFFFKEY